MRGLFQHRRKSRVRSSESDCKALSQLERRSIGILSPRGLFRFPFLLWLRRTFPGTALVSTGRGRGRGRGPGPGRPQHDAFAGSLRVLGDGDLQHAGVEVGRHVAAVVLLGQEQPDVERAHAVRVPKKRRLLCGDPAFDLEDVLAGGYLDVARRQPWHLEPQRDAVILLLDVPPLLPVWPGHGAQQSCNACSRQRC